jgi:hypothetical protein
MPRWGTNKTDCSSASLLATTVSGLSKRDVPQLQQKFAPDGLGVPHSGQKHEKPVSIHTSAEGILKETDCSIPCN